MVMITDCADKTKLDTMVLKQQISSFLAYLSQMLIGELIGCPLSGVRLSASVITDGISSNFANTFIFTRQILLIKNKG